MATKRIYIADLAISIKSLSDWKKDLTTDIGRKRADFTLDKDDAYLQLDIEELEDYSARLSLVLKGMREELLEYWENTNLADLGTDVDFQDENSSNDTPNNTDPDAD